MKNLVLVIFSFLCITTSSSQEEVLFNLRGSYYNDSLQAMTSCKLQLKYNLKKDVVFFMISEESVYVSYLFTKDHRDSMYIMLEKYLTWQKKAIEMDAEVDKEIGQMNTPAYFSYYNTTEKHMTGYAVLKTYFLSQNLDWHQLILKFGIIEDRKNRFISHKPKNIYLDKSQVLEFKKAFDANYLNSFKETMKKQKSIRKLFK